MINSLKIKPILDQKLAECVMKASRENGHLIFQPTHYVEKNGDIIGAFNVGQVPISTFWMHTEKAQIRDSFTTITVAENIARARRDNIILLLSKPESPFSRLISQIGYAQMDSFNLNYKLLD